MVKQMPWARDGLGVSSRMDRPPAGPLGTCPASPSPDGTPCPRRRGPFWRHPAAEAVQDFIGMGGGIEVLYTPTHWDDSQCRGARHPEPCGWLER